MLTPKVVFLIRLTCALSLLTPFCIQAKEDGRTGRFLRITVPGNNKILTLNEVEIYSGGKNVARGGKTTQSSTAHGGVAERAIDGNKNTDYNAGGQTHTDGSSTKRGIWAWIVEVWGFAVAPCGRWLAFVFYSPGVLFFLGPVSR